MRIYKARDYEHISQIAANIIASQITLKPDSVLGLATGGTPVGTYKKLVEKHKNCDLCFSGVKSINLDEYCGLSADSPQSYAYFMNENLFSHVNIKAENINIPNGLATDAATECKRYDEVVRDNPMDIQLLGIGMNGHIGFNEPANELHLDSHHVGLTSSTIEANKRYFEREEDVPKTAYTVGIGAIMSAKQVLLLASGEAKADILYKALKGPITTEVPASLLQLHINVIVVADEAALGKMVV